MKQTLIAIVGAAVGGALGYYGFHWMIDQGYYGLMLPGGLLGLGASFGTTRSIWLAVGFGLAAVVLGIFTEWTYRPFRVDDGFVYFLLHVTKNPPITLMMIALGGALGFWIPYRRIDPPQESGAPSR
jgi:hypothetical protein